METAWFAFLAAMIAMYVVLDGFDLGVGALHRLLPRGDEEREQAVRASRPCARSGRCGTATRCG